MKLFQDKRRIFFKEVAVQQLFHCIYIGELGVYAGKSAH